MLFLLKVRNSGELKARPYLKCEKYFLKIIASENREKQKSEATD